MKKNQKKYKNIAFLVISMINSFSIFCEGNELSKNSGNITSNEINTSIDNSEHKAEIKEQIIPEPSENEISNPEINKNYFLAIGDVFTSNIILVSFNHFVLEAEYAQINIDTIYDNLSNPWVWDQDSFVVNQLGHPYQGSFYFVAGRSNNFSFSESLLYTVMGSVSWEYICENERQSINDLICTTFGGAALGEVFHRLYAELSSSVSPLAIFISPMDALNELITGKKAAKNQKDGITGFTDYLSLGQFYEKVTTESGANEKSNPVYLDFSGYFNLIYGNSFNCDKKVPYSFFTFDLGLVGTKNFFEVKTQIEGILHRFGTEYTDTSKYMLGFSMLFDVTWSSLLSLSSNGIGLMFRSQSDLKNETKILSNAGLYWNIFGGSDYYNLYQENIFIPDDGLERREYDYGTGFYAKYNFSLDQKSFGTLSAQIEATGIFSFDSTIPEYGSKGFSIVLNSKFSYDHIIVKNYSLGLCVNIYSKFGYYSDADDINQNIYSMNLYVKHKIK